MTKDSTTAARLEQLEDLKDFVIMISGCYKGKEDDIQDIKRLLKSCAFGWIEENKKLEAKLKIAREALGNANKAFSNILRDKDYQSFTLEDFKFHMKASMFLCESMREQTAEALSQLYL